LKEMTPEEYRSFMVDTARIAKIATVRADGRPHVVPIWYVMDGDDLIFTTWHTTVKAKNITRDPRVAVSVDSMPPPHPSFVLIEGTAEIFKLPPEELLPWTTKLAERYMPGDQMEFTAQRNAVEGEWLVRVTPQKIIAKHMTD
jgi:PPOX class probable F420-dependent enzyme